LRIRFDPRHFLLALTVLALWLAWLVVRPFAGVIFLAAVVATVVTPTTSALARRLGNRRGSAAAIVTIGILVALAGPLAAIVAVVVGQAGEAVIWLTRAVRHEGLVGLVARLPEAIQPLAATLVERIPNGAEEVKALLQSVVVGSGTFATVGGVLQATGTALSQFLLFFVALYFLIADGPKLVEWLKLMLPLPDGKAAVLFKYVRRVTTSVVVSTLATSGVQATLALVGYLIAGVPSAIFFALLTFFTSFVPAVGTMLIWLPLAALKFGNGHVASGVFLVAWGVLVVGMADNFVKPVLIRRGVSFPIGLVFFALIGGLAAFGPVGLVAGPLTLAFLVATVRAWHEW
jgi:predicted PurR-regulated permease PerM